MTCRRYSICDWIIYKWVDLFIPNLQFKRNCLVFLASCHLKLVSPTCHCDEDSENQFSSSTVPWGGFKVGEVEETGTQKAHFQNSEFALSLTSPVVYTSHDSALVSASCDLSLYLCQLVLQLLSKVAENMVNNTLIKWSLEMCCFCVAV